MNHPEELSYSLAEEDYIKAIYHLSRNDEEGVSTNAIAEKLSTRPASVSDMLQKLAQKKVVNYAKYKGVSLTDEGLRVALRIVRKHRLWEVFLVEKLRFHWDQVHEVAEQLEHISSALLIERLDEFLGFPRHDPHGDPIPDKDGVLHTHPQVLLAELGEQRSARVVAVKDTSQAFLRYLDKVGIYIGARIKILDKIEYDGSLEVEIDEKRVMMISGEVARNLLAAE